MGLGRSKAAGAHTATGRRVVTDHEYEYRHRERWVDEPSEHAGPGIEQHADRRADDLGCEHAQRDAGLYQSRIAIQVNVGSQAVDIRAAISAYSTTAAFWSIKLPSRKAFASTPVGNGINAAVPKIDRLSQLRVGSNLRSRSIL